MVFGCKHLTTFVGNMGCLHDVSSLPNMEPPHTEWLTITVGLDLAAVDTIVNCRPSRIKHNAVCFLATAGNAV